MRVRSVSWESGQDPAASITIGEFEQGAAYRTVRRGGTPNFLFIMTMDGGGRVLGPGAETLPTKPGDILLYEPNTFHHYGTAAEAGRWFLAWSHFVPPDRWDYWSGWESPWPGVRIFPAGPVALGRACDALRIVHDGDFGSGALLGAFMLNCVERAFLHLRQVERSPLHPAMDTRIEKGLHYILHGLDRDLAISAVARHCGLSVSRFAHLFREQVGETPQRFIEARRMEQARSLLRFSSLPVAEVARACGFEDPFYFSSRFNRLHGRSPRGFRDQGPAAPLPDR